MEQPKLLAHISQLSSIGDISLNPSHYLIIPIHPYNKQMAGVLPFYELSEILLCLIVDRRQYSTSMPCRELFQTLRLMEQFVSNIHQNTYTLKGKKEGQSDLKELQYTTDLSSLSFHSPDQPFQHIICIVQARISHLISGHYPFIHLLAIA